MLLKLLMLLVLLALIGVFIRRKQLGPSANPLLVFLVVVAVVVGLAQALLSGPRRPPSLAAVKELMDTVGYKLGQAVALACPAGGDVVVFAAVEPGSSFKEQADRQLAGLKRGFGKTPLRIAEVAPNAVRGGPQGWLMVSPDPRLLSQVLQEQLQRHPQAVAAVSFVGLPDGNPAAAPSNLPPLFVLSMLDAQYSQAWLQSGQLRAAVVRKAGSDWTAKPQGSPDEVFNQRFILLTPETATSN